MSREYEMMHFRPSKVQKVHKEGLWLIDYSSQYSLIKNHSA